MLQLNNFKNQKPEYEENVLIVTKDGDSSIGYKTKEDKNGMHYYLDNLEHECLEEELKGWLEIPTSAEKEWPKEG